MAESKQDAPTVRAERIELSAGQVVAMANKKSDVRTLYADAVQGMALSRETLRFSLVEHFVAEDGIEARYVVNLVMPIQQLRGIGELFVRVANETEEQLKDVE